MTEDLRKWIDEQSYETLLRRWRTAPAGDPIFQGEIGEYYQEAMRKKRAEHSPEELVGISKRIGW